MYLDIYNRSATEISFTKIRTESLIKVTLKSVQLGKISKHIRKHEKLNPDSLKTN